MIFVVKVKEDKQGILGAVTHVDGTARIQTVSRKTNPLYWELIEAFRKITGIPVVLNTSFNNNAEPIVDSIHDAVVCFLTTKLNYLVIGDYLVHKKDVEDQVYLRLVPTLPAHNLLIQTNRRISLKESARAYEIKNNIDNGYRSTMSAGVYHLLNESNGSMTLGEAMEKNGNSGAEEKKAIIAEILELWRSRFITMKPKTER